MSPVPMYVQAKEVLTQRIRSGVYAVGDRLPSESEIARELGVSSGTAKQAVNALAAEGIVTRRPSQGTFVASVSVDTQVSPLRGYAEMMRERGVTVSARLLSSTVQPAGASIAWHLGIGKDDMVLVLRRLRLAGELRLASEEIYIPLELVPDLATSMAVNFTESSFYRLLEERYGLSPISADEMVWARAAEQEEINQLGLKQHEPVMIAERVVCTSGNQKAFFTHTVFRADAYILRFSMHRYARGQSAATT